ncbi:hypothetical protein CAC42_7664 [Sphaceloma murrayae]|uniref:BZIP domain-containing protein n=1 Tax=Sphaceloma murrayae TaxID=2082308 RepID=A0A2K1QTC0_9PEZI|nr:hypothetical protein CAC42_7664 [Sphaceloma murrayae]
MSSKPSDAERNRLKQQRSRARRKEYLTDIEERLRTYERHGVQATVEVQNAARQVVAENQSLRRLLAKHNVSTMEIAAHLDHELKQGQPPDVKAACIINKKPEKRAMCLDKPTCSPASHAPTAAARVQMESMITPGEQRRSGATDARDEAPSLEVSTLRGTISPSPGGVTAQDRGHSNDEAPPHMEIQDAANRDQISCEEAAQVIASMRGACSTLEILPELGCTGAQKCMVKSSVVFDLS